MSTKTELVSLPQTVRGLTLKILHNADIFQVHGFQAAGVHTGLKKRRRDVALLYTKRPATCAGVFTQNAVVAAPVALTQRHVAGGVAHAIVCNSGCANACTGERGLQDARRMAQWTAEALRIKPEEVLVASTGMIGPFLPMDKVERGIKECVVLLNANESGAATEAIMTTDNVPKEIVVEATFNGHTFRVGGIAKGAGMIEPNMATMLGFLVTDAHVPLDLLKKCLRASVADSFNAVSVDHDTSTNDMALLLANGASGVRVGTDVPTRVFQTALNYVTLHLAKAIARDGEGATKLIQTTVIGATTRKDAMLAAKAIVNSPLVKCAIHGADPNWGRIVAAVGYSGAKVKLELMNVNLGNAKVQVPILSRGEPLAFDAAGTHQLLQEEEVHIWVDLGLGRASATAYGCDLTREYVDFNAHYTT